MSGIFNGPAIIESADTTIVVPPGASIEPNLAGGLVVNLEGGRT
jgi:N-methylhydantoinase A